MLSWPDAGTMAAKQTKKHVNRFKVVPIQASMLDFPDLHFGRPGSAPSIPKQQVPEALASVAGQRPGGSSRLPGSFQQIRLKSEGLVVVCLHSVLVALLSPHSAPVVVGIRVTRFELDGCSVIRDGSVDILLG